MSIKTPDLKKLTYIVNFFTNIYTMRIRKGFENCEK